MNNINKDLLRSKIIRSCELTALEKRYIERLIQTERVQATFVKGKFDGDGYHCTNCGIWRQNIKNLRFCAYCGAEMHGGFTGGAD